MAILKDYYNTGRDGRYDIASSTVYLAQTFTASSTYNIGSIKVQLNRTATPGSVHLALTVTSGGKPDTGSLCSFPKINGDLLTTDGAGEWVTFIADTNPTLSSGTKYAIQLIVPGATLVNKAGWCSDDSSPSYSGGSRFYSTNGGTTWFEDTASDMMFEVYDNTAANNANFFQLF